VGRANYPGTKIAITEYSFGNDDGISSALAHAEALAIFGREGWSGDALGGAGRRVAREDSFLLHLNYDARGGRARGERSDGLLEHRRGRRLCRPETSGQLALLLFNKDTVVRPVTATLAGTVGFSSDPVRLFGFDGSHRLHAAGRSASAALSPSTSRRGPRRWSRSSCRPRERDGLWPVTRAGCSTRGWRTVRWAARVGAGATRLFTVAGTCGVPSDALGVAYNLTSTSAGAAGSSHSSGDAPPGFPETLWFTPGSTRRRGESSSLDRRGRERLDHQRLGRPAHVILDVSAFFR